MKIMVDKAFAKLKAEKPTFKIYTVSIWTDPDTAASSISFDNKVNSDKVVKKGNKWNKKYYDEYLAEGDLEMAKLHEPRQGRNVNPADFILRNFGKAVHTSIPEDWEANSKGRCWKSLEPALKEIGEYTLEKIQHHRLENDAELGVNGRSDWYEFIWRIQ